MTITITIVGKAICTVHVATNRIVCDATSRSNEASDYSYHECAITIVGVAMCTVHGATNQICCDATSLSNETSDE